MSETEKMAPTASMETVMIIRPFKVGAAIIGFVSMLVSGLFIGASDWIEQDGWRQGLWEECIETSPGRVNCTKFNPPVYVFACRGLVILGLIMTFIASVTVCRGLNNEKMSTRYRCYFIAMLVYFLGVMFDITALIIFPVKYSESMGERAGEVWSVGWTYWIGWLVAGLMLTSALLLCLDKDADEITYREKVEYENGIEDDDEVII
ncbi:claudin-10-like isoform X2 [Mya arenaria]|uniref:claudin-10-like isoform X2 n=1 Tax=Mya arenaria TaxID=6604 RepID=UPI0022E0A056|nr:claudin-10-like isoform X2 [Mya arenaria]XP_052821008.1 claudin-10-like isoform X2 [Mya arenaria]